MNAPAHLLRGAACAIRAFGLHQTEFFPGASTADDVETWWGETVADRDGLPPPMCVVGALRFAASGSAAYSGDLEATEAALTALALYLTPKQQELEAASFDLIVAWSDEPGRIAADVAATLEASAQTAEVLANVYLGAGNAYAAMPDAHGAPFLLSTGRYAEGGYSQNLEDWCEVEVDEPAEEIAAAKRALGIA